MRIANLCCGLLLLLAACNPPASPANDVADGAEVSDANDEFVDLDDVDAHALAQDYWASDASALQKNANYFSQPNLAGRAS